MTEKKRYVKPTIHSNSLLSKKAVADKCWSPSHDDAWNAYYNDPGFGGVQFTMASNGGNCGSQFTIVKYLNNSGNEISVDEYLAQHPEYSAGTIVDTIHSEISTFLTGNDGTNFHANPPKVTDGPPTEPWSV